MTHMSRSRQTDRQARVRAFRRAARAWQADKPHTAWEILATAGYADHWREFQRIALRKARARFLARMGG